MSSVDQPARLGSTGLDAAASFDPAILAAQGDDARDAGERPALNPPVRVCFTGFTNLTVLAPQIDGRSAGGEPVQQTLLAKAFVRRGYDVSMITIDCGQRDGAIFDGVKVFKAFALKAGVPVLRFVHPRFTGLWAALKRADADVYYVSGAGAILGQVALFCQRYRRRFVFRIASDADCAPDTLLIQYWRDRRLYEHGLRRAHSVLAQSVRQCELLRRNYGVESVVAGMLVPESGQRVPAAARDIDVLWVSNIKQLKRPDLLLEAARALPQYSFHMAGGVVPAEPGCFAEAERRARELPNLTFHGAVPYREIDRLFRRARIFVNTSDVEGFPNSYLQAWASGAPVVARFDPDQLIATEGLGIAVSTQEQMAAAISRLLQDDFAWKAASERCLAFIERRFGENVVLAPYERVLRAREG